MAKKRYAVYLIIIVVAEFLVNKAPSVLTDIPLNHQLSSDAEVHINHWRQFSANNPVDFSNDRMFSQGIWPKGQLFIDKLLVKTGEWFGQEAADWSISVSIISLVIFLSGVYFIITYGTGNSFWGLLLSLGSIVPTISLGGSSWGFLTKGFLPRELGLGIAVWLLALYFYSLKNNKRVYRYLVFALTGVFSNWYPIMFLHFFLLLFIVEIIRQRSFNKEHVFYVLLFIICAPLAFIDFVTKSSDMSPINMAIFYDRFKYMLLNSPEYALLKYLRRSIIYTVLVVIVFLQNRILKNKTEGNMLIWQNIWLSSGVLSIVGVLIENFTPFAKFLISRTSIWFIFSSMFIITYGATETAKRYIKIRLLSPVILAFLLLVIFLGQSSLVSIYRNARGLQANSSEYRQYITGLEQLKTITPAGSIILANPNNADDIRIYGQRGTWASWKDGNIAIIDGRGATEWFERMQKTNEILEQKDFIKIKSFSKENGVGYFFYRKGDIVSGLQELEKNTIFKSGVFGIAQIR